MTCPDLLFEYFNRILLYILIIWLVQESDLLSLGPLLNNAFYIV